MRKVYSDVNDICSNVAKKKMKTTEMMNDEG